MNPPAGGQQVRHGLSGGLRAYGGMIAHVLTFAAHRRTLVALALSRHGVDELGWGDPMRWVAQSAT